MSESYVDVNKHIKELGLKNQSQVPVNSIVDLKLVCEDDPELIPKFIDVLLTHLKTEKPVESDAVHKVFVAMFHQDKKASLTEVLKHLTKVPPPKKNWLSFNDELELHKTHVLKTCIADLIEKNLEKESIEELQQLAEFLEAGVDAFDVSDTIGVSRFISRLQMAVPFFARGAPCSKLLELVNNYLISPAFDKLLEQRKLDFLRALAEISSHTTTQVACKMLPSIVKLLKEYTTPTKMEEFMSFAYVECLLYVLHRSAHKDIATLFCNEKLESVRSITRERMTTLAKILPKDDEKIWQIWQAEQNDTDSVYTMSQKFMVEAKRQNTKSQIRSCTNIVAMIELFMEKKPSYIGDYRFNFSWKEGRKAPPTPRFYRVTNYSKAPSRFAALEDVLKEHRVDLHELGICYINESQVEHLLGLSKFQQVSRNQEGRYVLNDCGDIAMLCWLIRESDLSLALGLVENIGEEGRTGKVRDQKSHLLCWTYASSDLCKRSKNSPPLCPWYLCAFCESLSLGTDEKAKEPRADGRIHHCYGSTIESALRHIQNNGIPRESVSEFMCTDYQPPSANEPWMERRKIKHYRQINTLKDALKELEKRPVGADLLYYHGLMEPGSHIYYGPMSPNSSFVTYHAVVIEAVKKVNDQLVAVCKMSNGELVADGGYVNVSLATQYIPVGASNVKRKFIRCLEEPMHLLTDFFVVEMDDEYENEDGKNEDKKKDTEDDENEDGKNEDKKKDSKEDEEPEEEYKEYIPKSKRSPASTPTPKRGRGAYGRIRSTPSDLLVNNVGMLGIEDPITVTGSDAVDVIKDAITRHNSDLSTKAMALVALLNLSSRFPSISERIKDVIVKQNEFNSIFNRHKDIRSSLVERVPVLDEATNNVRRADSFPAAASTMAKPSVSLPNGVEKPAVPPLVDLLDLDSDDILAAPSSFGADFLQDLLGVDLGSAQCGATQAPKAGTDLLLDILSIETPSPAQSSTSSIDLLSTADVNNNPSIALDTLSSPAPPDVATTLSIGMFDLIDGISPSPSKEATNGPAYPPIVAYERSSLKIQFTFSKPPGNPQTTNVQATFTNLSPNTFTDFIFQAAVPKFLLMHLDPASSNTIPASSNGNITQNLRVTNSQHGKVWCIGEYGFLLVNKVAMLGIEDPITITESDAVDVIEDAITRHNSDSTTKAMALVALLKLSSHFPSISEKINDIFVKQKGSLHLEFNSIVDRHKIVRSSLVERMPVLDEATFNVRRAGSLPASVSTISKPSVSIPNGVAAAPLVDSDDTLASSSSSGADFLQDLLGVDLGSSSAQSD